MPPFEPPLFPPRTYMPQIDPATQFNLPKKTAVLLHPRRREVPDPFASKFGGRPAWPRDEPWPYCTQCECPFVAIVQLTRADIPELPFLEGKDLFQLLWCPGDHGEDICGPLPTTRWRAAREIGPVTAPPFHGEYYNRGHVPLECAIFPERIEETNAFADDEERAEVINAWVAQNASEDFEVLHVPEDYRDDAYETLFSVAPSTKVGGYVSFVQDLEPETCSCGREMTLMLSLSSSDFGDGTSWYRWAPSDYPRQADGSVLARNNAGTGFCLGDMGMVYVFICKHCKSLPIWTILQCG